MGTLANPPRQLRSQRAQFRLERAYALVAARAQVGKLSADSNGVLADREVRSRMRASGADPSGNTPDEFARFIRADQAKWAKLMREAGIKPE
jgi:tripartite-type tricarboxylate transporter receptor subunit TctC